jgi:riboflavin synthase alpha subunit
MIHEKNLTNSEVPPLKKKKNLKKKQSVAHSASCRTIESFSQQLFSFSVFDFTKVKNRKTRFM